MPPRPEPPLRAAAALSLTGRYAGPGRQAAAGLSAWASWAGASLRIEDDESRPARSARLYRELAGSCDLLFGPYGSGAMQAVAEALGGLPDVVLNHGGAVQDPGRARVVSIIAQPERYWAGLASVLGGGGVDLDRVVVLHAPSGFGRATAAGAVQALRAAGARPMLVEPFERATAAAAASRVLAAGARAVVGCGRIEDDLALGHALAEKRKQPESVGLVVCGIARAAAELGDAVEGWLGPAQWWPEGPLPPVALPAGSDYPAAQALAAGLVASQLVGAAGSTDPNALWIAARALRTETFLGPFAVDDTGRQVALAPYLVRWQRFSGGLRRELAWAPPPVA